MYNEIDLDAIDTTQEPPTEEPARQYYFMAKCREWVREFERKNGRRPFAFTQTFGWPGNIRELENAIESAVVLCGDSLDARCLPLRVTCMPLGSNKVSPVQVSDNESKPVPHHLKQYLKQQEDAMILEALSKFNGRKEKAAQYLGISDRTLRYKISNMEGKNPQDR